MSTTPTRVQVLAKYPYAERIVATRAEIQAAATRIAQEMATHYMGEVSERDPLVLVCTLKGAFIWMSELTRALSAKGVPTISEFLCVSSYDGNKSTGVVRMLLDCRTNVQGRHVVIIEDIVETGTTIKFLVNSFKVRSPASVQICSLLDKPDARAKLPETSVKWVGWTLPNDGSFLVGGGLDWNERFRTLEDLVVLKPETYTKKPHHVAKL